MGVQNAFCKFRDRMERLLRRFAMRLMTSPWQHRHIDRTIALLAGDLDLANCPILVVGALNDGDRDPDISKIFRNIPCAKLGVEPGAVPAVKGVVDIAVPPRKPGPEVGALIGGCLLYTSDAADD